MTFSGTWPEFHAAIDAVLALYHTQTQHGALAGRSPYEMLQEHINNGWGKTVVGYTELLLAFCEEKPRLVYAGGYIRWGNNWYRHDRLLHYATQKITIRYPKHDPRFVFAFLGKKLLCAAPVAERYGFLDRDGAGAQEQLRMASELRRYIAGIKRDCDRLDLVAISQELVQHTTPPATPNRQEITISTELNQMMQSLEQATVSLLDQVAKQQPVSQWRSAAEINPLLANLVIEDDEELTVAIGG